MNLLIGREFEDWLRARLPGRDNIRITDVGTPNTGLSSQTLLFTLNYTYPEEKSERLVLRAGPRGAGLFPSYDMEMQARTIRALKASAIPVPLVRWYEPDTAVIGTPFFIMEFIEGEVPSDTAPGFHGQGLFFDATESERVAMWRAGIENMAALHGLDWKNLELPAMPGWADNAEEAIASQIQLLENWIRWGKMENIELIQRGMLWLKQTPVPSERLSLLWGDARPGNIIYREGMPVALLDWELASVGLPEFDLFYWWWSSVILAQVNGVESLKGLPDRAMTIAMYEKATGRCVADVFRYAETFAVLRLAIMGVLGVRACVSEVYSNDFLMANPAMRALEAALGTKN